MYGVIIKHRASSACISLDKVNCVAGKYLMYNNFCQNMQSRRINYTITYIMTNTSKIENHITIKSRSVA